MGLICSQALLAIIAAGGDNFNASLPGLRSGSRSVIQHTEIVDGLKLMVPLPMLSQGLNNSIWNTRAWTFHLFYYNFDSGALTLFPKITLQEASNTEGERLLSMTTPWPDTLASYSQMIEMYSPKTLTYPNDILRAFNGAQTVLQKMYGWSFAYGLPKQI